MSPIGFIDDEDEHLGVLGFRLPSPPLLRGRHGAAVPTGVILPEAKGGTPPYTYTTANRPAGTTFTAASRTLGGTPSAAGDNTVTYTATDSSTPAQTVSKTFEWSILDLLSTDAIMLQDFDGGKVGYGVSDFVFAYADTLISGQDLGFSNSTVWASAPRTVKGSIVDDPLAKRLLPTGAVMSSIQWRPQSNPDQFRIFDSNEDLDGNPVDSDIGEWGRNNDHLTLYLQRALNTFGAQMSFDTDWASGANWNITLEVTSGESTWIRNNLSEDDQFLLVIA